MEPQEKGIRSSSVDYCGKWMQAMGKLFHSPTYSITLLPLPPIPSHPSHPLSSLPPPHLQWTTMGARWPLWTALTFCVNLSREEGCWGTPWSGHPVKRKWVTWCGAAIGWSNWGGEGRGGDEEKGRGENRGRREERRRGKGKKEQRKVCRGAYTLCFSKQMNSDEACTDLTSHCKQWVFMKTHPSPFPLPFIIPW